MRFEVVRDIQTIRLQTSDWQCARKRIPTYGGQHGAGRFLDSARNDRAFYCATACGGKVVRSTKRGDGVSRQTFSLQTSEGPFEPAVGGLLNKAVTSFDETIQPRPWREGKQKTAAFGSSPPFGALRHHLPPAEAVGLWVLGPVSRESTGKRR